MIIYDFEQRSEAWHQIRLGKFTASSFASVMASDSTAAYQNIIAQVAGEIITREIEESYSSDAMQRGIELESEARHLYESIFGNVREVGFCEPDEDDPLYGWVGISPDGLIDTGETEFKCPLIKTHLEYIKRNELPNTYKWQVQGQLMITGLEYCDFMSYYPKMKPFIIRVFPDLEMHKKLTDKLLVSIEKVNEILKNYNEYDFLK